MELGVSGNLEGNKGPGLSLTKRGLFPATRSMLGVAFRKLQSLGSEGQVPRGKPETASFDIAISSSSMQSTTA